MRIEVGCFYPKELFRLFSDERIFGKFQSPVGISFLLLIQADILRCELFNGELMKSM